MTTVAQTYSQKKKKKKNKKKKKKKNLSPSQSFTADCEGKHCQSNRASSFFVFSS
jgi:hypothetical protein